jgi:WD40 repeat protein/serine/threonine protein kinase
VNPIPEPTRKDIGLSLAQLALARGFISQDQLRNALAEQSRILSAGKPAVPLQEILLEKGYITKGQLSGLLEEQGKLAGAAAPSHAPLGKYEIVRELGRGGMGVVYEAVDTQLSRRVALKLLLSPGPAVDAQEAQMDEERFLREARLSANLSKHPFIVSVYEAGILDGKRYLAMELIEGLRMSAWRKAGSTTIRQQVKLLRDVAVAVHHAHKQNVIHRDLKPDNILVDAQGQPHVTDFGLAKSIGQNVRVSLTASGMVVGTPAYMSPEQALGDKGVDHRTDVYAIGVMLYETLTGRLPFTGETAIEILMKAAKNPVPPPSSVVKPGSNPTLDRAIEGICLRTLEKEPGDRYATAEALAGDLTRWLKGDDVRLAPSPTRRKPPPPAKKSPARWIGIGVAAAAALILALIVFNSSPEPEPASARPPDPAELKRKREKREKIAALLEDARSRFREGKYAESLAVYDQVLKQDPGNASAIAGKNELREKEIESDLAAADVLLKEGKYREAFRAYSLVSARDPSSRRATAGINEAEKQMEAVVAKAREDASRAKSEAERLAAEQRRKESEEADRKAKEQAHLEKAQGPAPVRQKDLSYRNLAGHGAPVWTVAFSPDGKMLASGSVDQAITLWDVSRGISTLRIQEGSGVFGLAFSKDGKLASGNVDATLKLWDPATGKVGAVFRGHQQAVDRVVFSPDGTMIASSSHDGTNRLWDVATTKVLFTFDSLAAGLFPSPLFLDNGKILACGSGAGLLRFWDVKTGKEARAPLSHEGLSSWAVSPDGAILATAGWDKMIALHDPSTGTLLRSWQAHPTGIWSIAISPDGRLLASAGEDGMIKVWELRTGKLIDALSGHSEQVLSIAFHPGGKLLASASSDNSVRLWAVEALPPEESWKKAIDLLALIDPRRDTISGSWRKEGGRLLVEPSNNACLRLPYEAPEEYDFRMIFTRQAGRCGTAQFFVHQGRPGIWDLSKSGVGISDVAGVGSGWNPTRAGFAIQDDVRYVSVVQVRRERVRGWIDGQRQSEWIPTMGDLSTPKGWGVDVAGMLGLGNCTTKTTIESVQVLEVTGKGKLRTTPVAMPAVAAPASGLVAHWKLNEGSGTVAGDSSGNKLAAKLMGGASWSKGKAGGVHFDGVSQRIELPAAPSLEKLRDGSYTVSVWVKPEEVPSTPDNALIVRLPWFGLYYLTKQHFMAQHALVGEKYGTAVSPENSAAPGSYYHVVATVDRTVGSTKLVVDGVPLSEGGWAPGGTARDLWPGLWRIGSSKFVDNDLKIGTKGTIDSLRIYNRALSTPDIEALHKSELPLHEK